MGENMFQFRTVISLALLTSVLFLPANADEKKILKKEFPIADSVKLLHGTVSETQLEYDLKKLGLILQRQNAATVLPGVVTQIEPNSLADQGILFYE
jgi:hypothetical protein